MATIPQDPGARDAPVDVKDNKSEEVLGHSRVSGTDVGSADELLEAMGYTPELSRNRSTLQVAFMSFVLASIPYGLATTLYYPLIGGGPVDIIWGWVAVSMIIVCVAVSLGEITSVYPTAGGTFLFSSRDPRPRPPPSQRREDFVVAPVWLFLTSWYFRCLLPGFYACIPKVATDCELDLWLVVCGRKHHHYSSCKLWHYSLLGCLHQCVRGRIGPRSRSRRHFPGRDLPGLSYFPSNHPAVQCCICLRQQMAANSRCKTEKSEILPLAQLPSYGASTDLASLGLTLIRCTINRLPPYSGPSPVSSPSWLVFSLLQRAAATTPAMFSPTLRQTPAGPMDGLSVSVSSTPAMLPHRPE
jgi:hypothetical protein